MTATIAVYDDLKTLPAGRRGAVIAVGNFDGVHRGHQALLVRARAEADRRKVPLGVLSFAPHPRRLFRPDDPPFCLTPALVKAERLRLSGVDFLCTLPFDWDRASQSAEDFVAEIIVGGLAPCHVVVGGDFRFGQLRAGTPATIAAAGVPVMIPEGLTATPDGVAISSSRIRQALQQGDVATANMLLGWDWEIDGIVVGGDRRGRELGYPTANVGLGETLHPAYGIYASLIRLEGETAWRPSATNIGIRPMFAIAEGRLETFIFDFDRDIYGRNVRVRPVQRLRGEAKFESLDALIAQMHKDCVAARAILSAA